MTKFEPTFARRVFPCFDEPKFKAVYDLAVNHHKDFSVISSTNVKSRSEPDDNDRVTTSFELTPKMSTNNLAIVISDFSRITLGQEDHSLYMIENSETDSNFIAAVESKIMEKLEEITGITLEQNKMDIVAIPDWITSQSTWGLVILW